MNELESKYPEEIASILAKYPADCRRSAIMPLLHLAQRETGYLTKKQMQDVAAICEVSITEVASITGFYTLYHDVPAGKVRIQVCTDLPCAMRGADEFLEKLCENIGIRVGETTPDGLVTLEEVTCLAGCHHAPLFQVQSSEGIRYHENQTLETALEFIESLRRREQEAKE